MYIGDVYKFKHEYKNYIDHILEIKNGKPKTIYYGWDNETEYKLLRIIVNNYLVEEYKLNYTNEI